MKLIINNAKYFRKHNFNHKSIKNIYNILTYLNQETILN